MGLKLVVTLLGSLAFRVAAQLNTIFRQKIREPLRFEHYHRHARTAEPLRDGQDGCGFFGSSRVVRLVVDFLSYAEWSRLRSI